MCRPPSANLAPVALFFWLTNVFRIAATSLRAIVCGAGARLTIAWPARCVNPFAPFLELIAVFAASWNYSINSLAWRGWQIFSKTTLMCRVFRLKGLHNKVWSLNWRCGKQAVSTLKSSCMLSNKQCSCITSLLSENKFVERKHDLKFIGSFQFVDIDPLICTLSLPVITAPRVVCLPIYALCLTRRAGRLVHQFASLV